MEIKKMEINAFEGCKLLSLFYNPEFQKNWIKIGSNNRLFPWNPFVLAKKSPLISNILERIDISEEMKELYLYQYTSIPENNIDFQSYWNFLNGVEGDKYRSITELLELNNFMHYLQIDNEKLDRALCDRKELTVNEWRTLVGLVKDKKLTNWGWKDDIWLCFKTGILTRYLDDRELGFTLKYLNQGIWRFDLEGKGITSNTEVYEAERKEWREWKNYRD